MPLALTGKTITDPLYGNITLTDIESALVSTKVFQRLHNVRQLGLGHLVFPSAGYSRFSHSVGACHNADRMLSAIEFNCPDRTFSDLERQAFRIAALFHDLGHYPFSHTTEHAVKRFFRDGIFKSTSATEQKSLPLDETGLAPNYLDHEDTGKLIFLEDPEIEKIFSKSSQVSKDDVTNAYLNENLSTILSSDLDCDRLDYLRRTALHSGAPYGAVDVDFIVSKSTIDSEGRFCFGEKATRAADHLLVSRFYDFMQIPFHKTVAALEWSLEESVISLLRGRHLKLSQGDMMAMLKNGKWSEFDDGAMLELMRTASQNYDHQDVAKDHINAVLHRRPAKIVFSWEDLTDAKSSEQMTKEKLLNYKISECCDKLGLQRERFSIWKAPFKLSKAGPMLQGPIDSREYSEEEEQQLIHVIPHGSKKSVPLIDLPNTVSHHLSKLRYQVLRVYYLPRAGEHANLIDELRNQFADA